MAAAPPPVGGGPVTFRALYGSPEQDAYDGDYTAVMGVFTVATGGVGWDEDAKHASAIGVGIDTCNAFVGLFPYPGEDAGRTRLLHAPSVFPTRMGVVTPYDNHAYAFLDEVAHGVVQTVEFEPDLFSHTTQVRIPGTIALAETAWNAMAPHDALLDPLAAGADVMTVRSSMLMWVPPPLVSLFINRRLTPRQLMYEVLAEVAARGLEPDLGPFVNWCLLSGVKRANADTASVLAYANDVVVPVGDAGFLAWRQRTLFTMLPDLVGGGAGAATAATVRIAGLMGDLLNEQRATRADTVAARATASTPKTPTEYFKMTAVTKLMTLCNVVVETDLPSLWIELAAANGKREREVIEEVIRQVANNEGTPELAPVVTPQLAKKITTMRFSGTNLDDLSEGINPFCVVIMDHTTATGTATYNDALAAALDYDDLMRGSGTADLADIKSLKSSTKILIPETYALGRAMLQAFKILLIAILGEMHSEVRSFEAFLLAYVNRENFFMGRLQREDGKFGMARMLRYIQLVMRAWFDQVWNLPAARAGGVLGPDFQSVLTKMMVGDMSWLPHLPPQYIITPPAAEAYGGAKGGGKEGKPPKAKPSQVRNPTVNPRFEDFKTAITTAKFNDVIKKVGDPPKVLRQGKNITTCASYHLRGACFNNCSRAADHGPHSEAEDDQLYEWCKLAFE